MSDGPVLRADVTIEQLHGLGQLMFVLVAARQIQIKFYPSDCSRHEKSHAYQNPKTKTSTPIPSVLSHLSILSAYSIRSQNPIIYQSTDLKSTMTILIAADIAANL
jgi:hypothetical protein